MKNQELSEDRIFTHYLGKFLGIIGLIMFIPFISFWFTGITGGQKHSSTTYYSNSKEGEKIAKALYPNASKAVPQKRQKNPIPLLLIGVGLVFIGAILASIGRYGLSGSGIILSPEGERKDLEPWNRSKGRQLQDMLEETQLNEIIGEVEETKEVIKIRCSRCEALNDEEDNFCGNCGHKLDAK